MTQFPSVFQNGLSATNQNNVQPTSISQSYPQPMQTKQITSFNQNTYDSGRNDFPLDYRFQTAEVFQQPQSNPTINPQLNSNGNWYTNMVSQQQQNQQQGFAHAMQNLVDQIRQCTPTSSPIFILPNVNGNQPNPACPPQIYSSPCVPYAVPMPMLQSVCSKEGSCKCTAKKMKDCEAYERWSKSSCGNSTIENHRNESKIDSFCESWLDHRCQESENGAVCSKRNCPASIQLQAMVSQLLGIQGVISSAITRMLLKRIPGSNVHESVDEIIEKARRCIRPYTKEQLIAESKSSQKVNGLISLYLTSSSTLPRLIPILTNAQLKSNLLRSFVESFVNARLMEDQGCIGTETFEPLDEMILRMKSDEELRQLLAGLRERECEERVNLSFAAYGTQRQVSETKLINVQKKINQVEKEMERRHRASGSELWKNLSASDCNDDDESRARRARIAEMELIIDNPVSPTRLMLRPHVGSPETTYEKPINVSVVSSPEVPKENIESGKENMKISEKEVSQTDSTGTGNKSECFRIKLEGTNYEDCGD